MKISNFVFALWIATAFSSSAAFALPLSPERLKAAEIAAPKTSASPGARKEIVVRNGSMQPMSAAEIHANGPAKFICEDERGNIEHDAYIEGKGVTAYILVPGEYVNVGADAGDLTVTCDSKLASDRLAQEKTRDNLPFRGKGHPDCQVFVDDDALHVSEAARTKIKTVLAKRGYTVVTENASPDALSAEAVVRSTNGTEGIEIVVRNAKSQIFENSVTSAESPQIGVCNLAE